MFTNKHVALLLLVFTSTHSYAAVGDMPPPQPQPANNSKQQPEAKASPEKKDSANEQAKKQQSSIPTPPSPPPQGSYQPPLAAPPTQAPPAPRVKPRPPLKAKKEGTWGVGVAVGTLGYGVDITYGLSDRVNVRATFRTVEESQEISEDDIDYNVDFDVSASLLAIDWHPFYNGLRVTGGLFIGGFNFRGDATCQQAQCDIGGSTYTSAEIGTLTLDLDSGQTNPYIGIGYGNAAKGTGLGFSVDLGVMVTSDGQVDISSSSAACSPATPCGNDLQEQEDELQAQFKAYPVISVGLSYTF